MKISELILELQNLEFEHGSDIEVITSHAKIEQYCEIRDVSFRPKDCGCAKEWQNQNNFIEIEIR